MIHIVWLACTLLGAARARLYERCELARDLQALGVRTDHLATWVCIAWHESRFDTAANNPYSGDHGLFQISELYWCGAGKACGIPCHVLRDDDISNDLQCALQVHEEHTRLQGDGFQAWVVYPQHCKGNNKKYLVDCDLRSGFSRTSVDSTVPSAFRTTARPQQNIHNIDNLLPPYLLINSLFRERYGKVLDQEKIDWANYKYDKVDELKLPVLNSRVNEVDQVEYRNIVPKVVKEFIPNITTTYVPPVKPWRFIETNQFRKKATPVPTTTAKTATTQYESFAEKITASTVYGVSSSTQCPTSRNKLPFEKCTVGSSYSAMEPSTNTSFSTVTRDILLKLKSTTASYKSPTVSTKPVSVTNATYKLPTITTSYKASKSPTSSWFKFSTPSWQLRALTTTSRPVTSYVPFFRTTRTTTVRSTILAPVILTSKPSSKPWTFKNQSAFSIKPTATSSIASTAKTATTKIIDAFTYKAPGYTSTSRTKVPPQTIIPEVYKRTTSPPSTTPKLRVHTSRITIAPSTRKSSRTASPSIKSVQRSTQSIWDLYLNPTKPPKYQPFDFSRGSNKKLNIFSRGTTTASPA